MKTNNNQPTQKTNFWEAPKRRPKGIDTRHAEENADIHFSVKDKSANSTTINAENLKLK